MPSAICLFSRSAAADEDHSKPPGWVQPGEDPTYDDPPPNVFGNTGDPDVSPGDFPVRPPGMNPPPADVPEAVIKAPSWKGDMSFEFGIYEKSGKRIATAYYRIVKQALDGQDVWQLKYTGKNDTLAENTDCWIGLNDMLPLRSTRKLVQGSQIFYKDLSYNQQGVQVRKKYEGQQVQELNIPLAGSFYDYESLIWLVPQIDFGGAKQVRFELFDSLMEVPQTVFITDEGVSKINILGKNHDAHVYSFNVGAVPYRYYAIEAGGRLLPGRVEMGDTSFVNLQFAGSSGKKKSSGKKRRRRH